ncbi:MAG: TetR family transcriptional regulator [Actinomycetota bacterium]
MAIATAALEDARARILDAAFERAERFGLGRTTLAEVARAARLSRQTVYRYFPNRHALFAALVLREEERIVERVRASVGAEQDLRRALQSAFTECLRALREHPLLDKVMATEPHELLPYLTVEANPVMSLGMRLMAEVLAARAPRLDARRATVAAEMCARIFISYAITPAADDPRDVAADLAALIVKGIQGDEA